MTGRMRKYTHEAVTADGKTVARLRIAKNYQIAVDDPALEKIAHSGGSSAFGYHVCYSIKGRNDFPADDIDCELHYFTGRSYSNCMIIKNANR